MIRVFPCQHFPTRMNSTPAIHVWILWLDCCLGYGDRRLKIRRQRIQFVYYKKVDVCQLEVTTSPISHFANLPVMHTSGQQLPGKNLVGGCQCGAIRYELIGKPSFSSLCYCGDCQKASGSGFVPVMGYTKANFKLEGGSLLKQYRCTSSRGRI